MNQILSGVLRFQLILVAVLYLLGSLLLDEVHPFSKYPMYNSFPNWSYVFFLTDKNDKLIPCQNLEIKSGKMGHMFYSVCSFKNIPVGDGLETPQQLDEAGKDMMDLILKNDLDKLKKYGTIKLNRFFFHYNDSNNIMQTRQVMHERNVE